MALNEKNGRVEGRGRKSPFLPLLTFIIPQAYSIRDICYNLPHSLGKGPEINHYLTS